MRVSGALLISLILNVSFNNPEKSTFDAHTNLIFKNLNILKFENLIKLQIGKIMYLYKNGLLPDSFNDMFLLHSDVHSCNTRSKNLEVRIPSVCLTV